MYYMHSGYWTSIFDFKTLCVSYSNFYGMLESVIVKTVTIGPRDPEYVTSLIKLLLRQRNRLRRKGRTEDADKIA